MTFSITAIDPGTGWLGVGVSTCFPAVGGTVPFVRMGVGAIASQAMANPYLGHEGLRLLESGLSADKVVEKLRTLDIGFDYRQVVVVDATGGSAAHSGPGTQAETGHRIGSGYGVAGNILADQSVLDEIERAYIAGTDSPFPDRLIAALEAGQQAGGDRRGKQSAALLICGNVPHPVLDLRVDDHPDPLPELQRLYGIWKDILEPKLAKRPKPIFSQDSLAEVPIRTS